jgi:hypothetical protein
MEAAEKLVPYLNMQVRVIMHTRVQSDQAYSVVLHLIFKLENGENRPKGKRSGGMLILTEPATIDEFPCF